MAMYENYDNVRKTNVNTRLILIRYTIKRIFDEDLTLIGLSIINKLT